jgi:hypothetical protein
MIICLENSSSIEIRSKYPIIKFFQQIQQSNPRGHTDEVTGLVALLATIVMFSCIAGSVSRDRVDSSHSPLDATTEPFYYPYNMIAPLLRPVDVFL